MSARTPVGHRAEDPPTSSASGASGEPEDAHLNGVEDGRPEQQVTVSQDRLGRLLAKEKAQGERAAVKRLLSALGFDTPQALTEFVTAQREAERAALTEVERREQSAAERELQAARREELAAERERAAVRRAALVALGASGEDLIDAERLLAADDDADEKQIQAAGEALRARRPELFGEVRTPVLAAPAGAPAGRGPSRTTPPPKPGAAGLEMARRRGLVPEFSDAS
ncbi:hypothetical protein [Streptomyces bluensis]|uniref:hypothetical protein n=1 Tax=Streptomyces bluensis TaxID=33897 RepID=UPI0033315619